MIHARLPRRLRHRWPGAGRRRRHPALRCACVHLLHGGKGFEVDVRTRRRCTDDGLPQWPLLGAQAATMAACSTPMRRPDMLLLDWSRVDDGPAEGRSRSARSSVRARACSAISRRSIVGGQDHRARRQGARHRLPGVREELLGHFRAGIERQYSARRRLAALDKVIAMHFHGEAPCC